MILECYRRFKEIAERDFGEIVVESEIISSYTGRARKLRIRLIDHTFIDIWYSLEGDYSFHWEQSGVRSAIYRHDNAPHLKWAHVKTFPKHCHDGTQGHVVESNLSDKPEEAIREFLSIIRNKMVELRLEKD
ncbi:MAG: DUF6516 family protein [Thermodesulfobacteriota bacterium]